MREKLRQARELSKQHIDKKLRNKMIIYFVISLVMLGVMIYEIIIDGVAAWIAIIAMVIGLLLGSVTHRIFHISWHEDEQKVISRVDRTGAIILVVYILFSIFRSKIIGYYFQGPAVLAVTMSLVFGLMAGRVYGMRRRIIKVLKEQDVLE